MAQLDQTRNHDEVLQQTHQIILLMTKIIYTLKLYTNQQYRKKEFPFCQLILDPDFLLLEI